MLHCIHQNTNSIHNKQNIPYQILHSPTHNRSFRIFILTYSIQVNTWRLSLFQARWLTLTSQLMMSGWDDVIIVFIDVRHPNWTSPFVLRKPRRLDWQKCLQVLTWWDRLKWTFWNIHNKECLAQSTHNSGILF